MAARSSGKGRGRPSKGRPRGERPVSNRSGTGRAAGGRSASSRSGADRSGGSRAGSSRSGSSRGAADRSSRPRSAKDDGLGGSQVEGRQAVRELLLAGERTTYEVIMSTELDRVDIIGDIWDLASELRVPVTEVSRSKLDSMSRTDAPQGVMARAAELTDQLLDDLCVEHDDQVPFLLAVDGVTDPGNLGALLRIAECAGVTGVVLPKHRAVHVTPTVTKAAAGAVEYLPMALVGGLPTAIETMKAAGIWVVGLDAGGETDVHSLEVASAGVCLVLGAEGRGLSRLVRERCDLLASIPLHGRLASLNVASAGAVACYEVARRRAQ